MSFTQIKREQLINTDINTIWNFISSPANLGKITPKSMMFKITSNNAKQVMYPGMIISYKVAPLLHIPITWITEITHIRDKSYFVDEQRKGPYTMWHHEHIFEVTKKGVLMKDIITYVVPFGYIGKIINFLFIKKRVNQIFDYRRNVINKIFN